MPCPYGFRRFVDQWIFHFGFGGQSRDERRPQANRGNVRVYERRADRNRIVPNSAVL
jgi:hypothetical protein